MAEFPIYLIDDDDSVRRSISFMLRTSGHEVQVFEDGMEFLRQLGKLPPGCILLDIRMPRMGGLEVQAEIANRGIVFPVVVMTGHGDVKLAVQAMKAGAIDFIEKPFEKSQLFDALAQAGHRLSDTVHSSWQREDARIRLNCLTPREHDVLTAMAEGRPNKTIGSDLGISSRTVEIHRANLMTKLGVHNLSDLLRIAFAAGVGDTE